MRTIKHIWSLGLLTAGLLSTSACSDLLEVPPRSQADSQTALTTAEGLDAGLNGIYDRLQSTELYGRDLLALSEALSDNAQATNKSGRLNAENRNQPNASFTSWRQSYLAINQANLVLDNVSKVALSDTNRRNSIQGQAYFLRALLYHDLMRVYAYDPGVEITQNSRGGVPLVLTGVADQNQISFPARAPIADVYKQLYSDLQNSISVFGRSNTSNGNLPANGNRQAAQLLFSRIALYNKDYATAVKIATDAIAGTIKLVDNTAYIGGWRAPRNPESLFEIVYTTPENIGVNTSLQTTYTTLVRVGDRSATGGFGDLVPTPAFIADLESEKSTTGQVLDIRRQLYELGTIGRGNAFIESTKFLGKNGLINLDNVPVIRISEAYLNRAEASAMLGNTAEALADLNLIRTRSGLPARTDLTGATLLTEILRQRRLEYAFEGHRWFDLKRRGQDVTKTIPLSTTPNNVPYTDFRILANIPLNELSTNKSVKQNFGY